MAMVTMTPNAARINETLSGLRAAQQRRIERNPPRTAIPQFRTTGAGEVMNQQGHIIFRPRVPAKGNAA